MLQVHNLHTLNWLQTFNIILQALPKVQRCLKFVGQIHNGEIVHSNFTVLISHICSTLLILTTLLEIHMTSAS